jgi:hypothetical protein
MDAARPIGAMRLMPESADVMPSAKWPMVGPVASDVSGTGQEYEMAFREQQLTRLRLRPTSLVIMDHDHSE